MESNEEILKSSLQVKTEEVLRKKLEKSGEIKKRIIFPINYFYLSILIVLLVCSIVLPFFNFNLSGIHSKLLIFLLDTNNFSNQALIGVLAGIGTIIFALLIFVAEISREEKNTLGLRILLEAGNLPTLIICTIITFARLLFVNINCFIMFLIFLISLATISSIIHIINFLINRKLFFSKIKEKIETDFRLMIVEEVKQKISYKGKNNFLKAYYQNEQFTDIIIGELEEIENQYIVAIKNNNETELIKFRNTYMDLTNSVLKGISSYYFLLNQVKNKIDEFYVFYEIELISKSYYRLLNAALSTKNADIIFNVFDLSIDIAGLSINSENLFAFEDFTKFYPSFYDNILKLEDETKKIIIKNFATCLKDLNDNMNMIHKICFSQKIDTYTPKGAEYFYNQEYFFKYLLFVYYDMTKISFDKGEQIDFRNFLDIFNQFLDNFYKIEYLDKKNYDCLKEQLLFCLLTWMFYKNKQNNIFSKYVYQIIDNNFTNDFKKLKNVFIDVLYIYEKEKGKIYNILCEWETTEYNDKNNQSTINFTEEFCNFFLFILRDIIKVKNINEFIEANFDNSEEKEKRLLKEKLKVNKHGLSPFLKFIKIHRIS